MRVSVKIRDVKPGDVIAEKVIEMSLDDPRSVQFLREIADLTAADYPDAWMVTVELKIGVACVLSQTKIPLKENVE